MQSGRYKQVVVPLMSGYKEDRGNVYLYGYPWLQSVQDRSRTDLLHKRLVTGRLARSVALVTFSTAAGKAAGAFAHKAYAGIG